jgi:hypothetical protein
MNVRIGKGTALRNIVVIVDDIRLFYFEHHSKDGYCLCKMHYKPEIDEFDVI